MGHGGGQVETSSGLISFPRGFFLWEELTTFLQREGSGALSGVSWVEFFSCPEDQGSVWVFASVLPASHGTALSLSAWRQH